jgi:hypothetical protein
VSIRCGVLSSNLKIKGFHSALTIAAHNAAMKMVVWVFLLCLCSVVSAQTAAIPIKFSELYSKISAQGVELSPKLQAANGKRVEMLGYMAPPLKVNIDFFVLGSKPMAECPFCTSVADWPSDIVLVLFRDGRSVRFSAGAVRVRGKLELGVKEDPDTGFVSLIRIYADEFEVIKK